jgi:hypothetical protein
MNWLHITARRALNGTQPLFLTRSNAWTVQMLVIAWGVTSAQQRRLLRDPEHMCMVLLWLAQEWAHRPAEKVEAA